MHASPRRWAGPQGEVIQATQTRAQRMQRMPASPLTRSAVRGPRRDRMLQSGRKGQLPEQSGGGDRKLPAQLGWGRLRVPEGRRPTSPEERCGKVSSASVSGSGQTFWPPEWSDLGPCIHAAKPTRGPEDTGRDPQDPALWAQVLSHSPGSSP